MATKKKATKRVMPKKVPASKKAKTAEAKKATKKKAATKKPATKKEATKKPAAKKSTREPLVEQNGVKRPRAGGKTAIVWELADKLAKKAGECPKRKDVLEAAKELDCNPNMANCQFQSWRAFNGYTKTK